MQVVQGSNKGQFLQRKKCLAKCLSTKCHNAKMVRAAWVVSKKEIKLKLDTKNWATHSHDAKVGVGVGVAVVVIVVGVVAVTDTRRRRHCSQRRCSLDFQLDRDLGSFPVQLLFLRTDPGLAWIQPIHI